MQKKKDIDFDLASSWFYKANADLTLCSGISLGKCLQAEVYEDLRPNIHQIKKGALVSYFFEHGGKWRIRALLGLFSIFNDSSETDVLFICDNYSTSCLEITNKLARSLESLGCNVSVLLADDRIGKKINYGKRINYFSAFRIQDLKRAKNIANGILRILKRHAGENPLFLRDRSTYRSTVSKVRQASRDVIAVENIIIKKSPKAIVVTSVSSRLSKASLLVAKKKQIHSYSVPHGFPVQKYALCPIEAGLTYVWSKYTDHILRSMNDSDCNTKVVGCLNKSWLIQPVEGSGKCFYAPNPIDESLLEKGFKLYVQLLRDLKIEGVVKLHPSQISQSARYKKWIPSDLKDTIKISIEKIDDVGIGIGDVVFLFNSTVGIDAIACGAKVISFNDARHPNTINYDIDNLGVEVNMSTISEELLLEAYHRLSTVDRNSFLSARRIFLEKMYGSSESAAIKEVCSDIYTSVHGDVI